MSENNYEYVRQRDALRKLPALRGGKLRDDDLQEALELAALHSASPGQRVLIVLDHWAVFRSATQQLDARAMKLLFRELETALTMEVPAKEVHLQEEATQ